MAPTLRDYICRLEAALRREWSPTDMARAMNRVLEVFKNNNFGNAATTTTTNDALADQVRHELAYLNIEDDDSVSDILLKYYEMILQAMPAMEINPPLAAVVDFDMDAEIDYFYDDEDEEEEEEDSGIAAVDFDVDMYIDSLCFEDEEGEQDSTICVVCQENLYGGNMVVYSLRCGHKFHIDCIAAWLRHGSKFCPLCKAAAALPL